MKIICAWCEVEGKPGLMGERAPMLDDRPTHGICQSHLIGYLTHCGVALQEPLGELDQLAEQPLAPECGVAPTTLSAMI